MGRKRVCVCTKPLDTSGRCTAEPSCSDFRKPAIKRIRLARQLRDRERRADAPGTLITHTEAQNCKAVAGRLPE